VNFREVVQRVFDFKAEQWANAASGRGREDEKHPRLGTLDLGVYPNVAAATRATGSKGHSKICRQSLASIRSRDLSGS